MATSQLTAHEFIFGDRFERSVQYIIGQAFKVNTREAYQKAIYKIEGIKTLIIFSGCPMPTAVLMLQTSIRQLQEIVDSEKGCLAK